MSELNELDEGSVVEYSLAELGFVLVFVLLLLSGWEINTNAKEIEKEAEALAILEHELESIKTENKVLKDALSKLQVGDSIFDDDLILVDKTEYLALVAKAEMAQEFMENTAPAIKDAEPAILDAITELVGAYEELPDDPVILSNSAHEALEKEKENLEQAISKLHDQLAKQQEDPNSGKVTKVGTVGFCTYDPPASGSKRVYGSSVAIGTVVVGEDGLTLVGTNSAIENGNFVDIAGDPYDTSRVTDAIYSWPLNKKMSRSEFRSMGAEFMEIGRAPSDKRVGCRFGMDYYIPTVSDKSLKNLEKDGLQGSFFKNSPLTKETFNARFPEYSDEYLSRESNPSPAVKEIETGKQQKLFLERSESFLVRPKEADQLVSAIITPARTLSLVEPKLPKKARRRDISGFARLSYRVSVYGLATEIEVVEEKPTGLGFAESAIVALKKSRFKPATADGVNVESKQAIVRFQF
jgi:cell division protein FtsB